MTQTPEDRRDKYYRRKYNLTLVQYNKMGQAQGWKCWICKSRRAYKLHVDHDHRTGRVRGLLCIRCNHRLLGRGLENPELHRRAAEYLERTYDGRAI